MERSSCEDDPVELQGDVSELSTGERKFVPASLERKMRARAVDAGIDGMN